MFYLSKLIPNLAIAEVQRDLRSPYQMHRTLQSAFGLSRQAAGLLYRLERNPQTGLPEILAQSTVLPDWTRLEPANYLLTAPPDPRQVTGNLQRGRTLHFRLCANPTIVRVVRDDEGNRRKNGRREALYSAEKQCAWLHKKASDHGFEVIRYQISQQRKTHEPVKRITLFTVQFDGILQVTDTDKFNTAWRKGIGSAKAFGCGLLSLARA